MELYWNIDYWKDGYHDDNLWYGSPIEKVKIIKPMSRLEVAQDKLEKALAALDDVYDAQNYSINSGSTGRSATRVDIDKLHASIDYWRSEVARNSGGGSGGIIISRISQPQ